MEMFIFLVKWVYNIQLKFLKLWNYVIQKAYNEGRNNL